MNIKRWFKKLIVPDQKGMTQIEDTGNRVHCLAGMLNPVGHSSFPYAKSLTFESMLSDAEPAKPPPEVDEQLVAELHDEIAETTLEQFALTEGGLFPNRRNHHLTW